MTEADKLLQAIQAQQDTIKALCEHIGLLTLSVAQLLGEEMGQPEAADDVERDWDGNPIG